MSVRRCPVCDAPVGARSENPAFPFCRRRCQQIDLGRWLGGDYVISKSLMPERSTPDAKASGVGGDDV